MEIASKSQAENGTDNNTIMTPLRVKQSISANAGGGGGSSVQSDWNEADTSSDAYIKNKPTNLAVTNQNNNFSTPQTVTSSVDVATSAFGFYKIGGVPIVQYNANNHKTVLYGAPYDEGVTNGAIYIRPDAVHGYGDVVVTPASTSVDKNLIVKGDTYEWGSHYIGNGNDLTLAPQGPTDTPPTNDAGDIVFNQWRDEGGGAYREIEKARIWTEDFYGLPIGPNYRAYDAQGNLLFTGHLALENNYSTDEKPIGVWKGYVLYRKIYEGYLNSNGTLDNSITVPGTIQRIEGYVYSIYANWWKIGSHYFPDPQYDSCFTIPQSSASFNIETNGYFNQNSKYVVIVEYTK